MDGASPTGDAQPGWRSEMIDVSGMSLSELDPRDDPDSPLARALRRVADEAVRAREPIAGFNSAL